MVNELQLSILCIISYILFYSCYDKLTKKLRIIPKLKQIFLFKNLKYSINEINKVLALSGLTLFAYSFITHASHKDTKIRQYAFYQLMVHGSYSLYTFFDKYYGPKKFAMFFGSCALTSMLLIELEFIPIRYSVLSLVIATVHFYIEISSLSTVSSSFFTIFFSVSQQKSHYYYDEFSYSSILLKIFQTLSN